MVHWDVKKDLEDKFIRKILKTILLIHLDLLLESFHSL